MSKKPNHPYDFAKKQSFEYSLQDMLDATDPKYFKFKIGDDVTVINEQFPNSPVRPGMRGAIRDYVPIVPVSDGRARSYSVELAAHRGKEFIVHEDALDLTSNINPDQFKVT